MEGGETGAKDHLVRAKFRNGDTLKVNKTLRALGVWGRTVSMGLGKCRLLSRMVWESFERQGLKGGGIMNREL